MGGNDDIGARHWAYRIAGGLLVWVLAVVNGATAGLAASGGDGFDALGGAIIGAGWGAGLGALLAALLVAAPAPARARVRWAVLGLLVLGLACSLALQESLD